MTYQARIISQRKQQQPVYLITGAPASSPPQWAYVRVDRLKEQLLLRAIQHPPFDVSDFGEVLASGHGITPPTHIVWEMEKSE